jgi:outer membrane autotransporter protein
LFLESLQSLGIDLQIFGPSQLPIIGKPPPIFKPTPIPKPSIGKPTPTPKPTPTIPTPKPKPSIPTPKPKPSISVPTPKPKPKPTPHPTPSPSPSFPIKGSGGEVVELPINIKDSKGNISPPLVVEAIKITANVPAITNAINSEVLTDVTSTNVNIELHMIQIRNVSVTYNEEPTNIFLVDMEKVSAPSPKFSSWLIGSGVFSYIEGIRSTTGTVIVGLDYFLSKNIVVGLLGAYGYSDTDIPGVKGHLLGNSKIGGIYLGAWTGEPGLYVTLSGLANYTNFRLLGSSNPRVLNGTGFVSVGYETKGKTWTWGPTASLQFDDSVSSSFIAANSKLLIHSNLTDSLQTRAGMFISYKKNIGSGLLKAQAQLMWERQYSGNGLVDVEFNGVPSTRVPIGEKANFRNSFWSSISVNYHLKSGLTIQSSYSLDLGERLTVHQIDLGFHVSF